MGAGLDAAAFYVETDNGSYEINNTSMYIRGGTLLGSHGSTSSGRTYNDLLTSKTLMATASSAPQTSESATKTLPTGMLAQEGAVAIA